MQLSSQTSLFLHLFGDEDSFLKKEAQFILSKI